MKNRGCLFLIRQGALLLVTTLLIGMCAGCGNSSTDNMESEDTTGDSQDTISDTQDTTSDSQEQDPVLSINQEYILPVKDAQLTGQGITMEGQVVDTAFSEDINGIVNFGTGSTITYTVPEQVEGIFDIYLDISKSFFPFGTTVVSVAVNGGSPTVMPVYLKSCTEEDYSDLYVMESFLMKENESLRGGDTITITGLPGYEMEAEGSKTSLMPAAIGSLYLYSAETRDEEIAQEADPADPLSGINIAWLGSSVTYGMASGGYSMTNAIEDNHPSTRSYNYSICGTTLVNKSESSYVERLKQIDPQQHFDLFIVQLSTNDASEGMPFGEISADKDINSLDDTTIAGAIEYIIAYVTETWDCPVVFYTGTYYESEEYSQMVELLKQIQDKWDIGLINQWDNPGMKALYGTDQYKEYMADDIHPTYKGYVEWWTPVFEEYLSEYLSH